MLEQFVGEFKARGIAPNQGREGSRDSVLLGI